MDRRKAMASYIRYQRDLRRSATPLGRFVARLAYRRRGGPYPVKGKPDA